MAPSRNPAQCNVLRTDPASASRSGVSLTASSFPSASASALPARRSPRTWRPSPAFPVSAAGRGVRGGGAAGPAAGTGDAGGGRPGPGGGGGGGGGGGVAGGVGEVGGSPVTLGGGGG